MNTNIKKGVIAGLIVVIAVLIIVGITRQQGGLAVVPEDGGETTGEPAEPTYEGRPLKEVFQSEVSLGARVSDEEAQSVTPASTIEGSDSTRKARRFDLRAMRNGFEPATITVNQWDRVELDFTAVDGEYDFSIPYLGSYFFPAKQGETKLFIFSVPTSGTFTFECRDYCPSDGTIKGSLIVLPKEL